MLLVPLFCKNRVVPLLNCPSVASVTYCSFLLETKCNNASGSAGVTPSLLIPTLPISEIRNRSLQILVCAVENTNLDGVLVSQLASDKHSIFAASLHVVPVFVP